MDLNSDLGEGYGPWTMGDDQALLKVVTSANIACGFHAGDPSTMRRTVELAVQHGVTVGAHVSYPDRRGFGRRHIDLPPSEVTDDLLYQVGALDALARAAGTKVSYVKPHGALYNEMASDERVARAVVEGIRGLGQPLPLMTLPGSVAAVIAAEVGLPTVAEGFADRAYTSDGQLVPRDRPGAVLGDADEVAVRAVRMAVAGRVTTIEGTDLALRVDSLCVHGDSPGAVSLARAVRAALTAAGVPLRSFI